MESDHNTRDEFPKSVQSQSQSHKSASSDGEICINNVTELGLDPESGSFVVVPKLVDSQAQPGTRDDNEKEDGAEDKRFQGQSSDVAMNGEEVNKDKGQSQVNDYKNGDWSFCTFMIRGTDSRTTDAVQFSGSDLSPMMANPTFRRAVEEVIKIRDKDFIKVTEASCLVSRQNFDDSDSDTDSESKNCRSDGDSEQKDLPLTIEVIYPGLKVDDLQIFQETFSSTGGDAETWNPKNLRVASRVEKLARHCGLVKLGEQASAILQQVNQKKSSGSQTKIKENKSKNPENLDKLTKAEKEAADDRCALWIWIIVFYFFMFLFGAAIFPNKFPAKFHRNCQGKSLKPPRDCLEIQMEMAYEQENHSNIHDFVDPGQGSKSSSRQVISPLDGVKREVLCDFETDGGGWTIIQQRHPGAPHDLFHRDWDDYVEGFGFESSSSSGSFWLGLKYIRALHAEAQYVLLIEMTDWEGQTRWAKYGKFIVEPATDSYRLRIWSYSGNAGDSMGYHSAEVFSTPDMQNNWKTQDVNCAKSRHSGWWFKSCSEANLNGLYWDGEKGQHKNINQGDGITWNAWKGPYYSLKSVQMKIRPAFFDTDMNQWQKVRGGLIALFIFLMTICSTLFFLCLTFSYKNVPNCKSG